MITHHNALRDAWPLLATRLGAYLRRRGASGQDADDIVQECAVRVLTREVPFADADDLLTWCLTVARNAHVDLHRARGRLATDTVPDLPAGVDVHDEVAARLRLQAVVEVWSQLSAADRRVLVEAVEGAPGPPVRRDAVRLYVQRNRARQRLQALTAALIGVLVAVGRHGRRQFLPLASLTAAGAVTCLAFATAPSGGSPESRRVPAPHAARAVLGGGDARPFVLETGMARRVVTAGKPSVPTPQGHVRTVAAAAGPDGYGARVTSHDRPDSGSSLVCVGDLPAVPDECVPDPTGRTALPTGLTR